MIPEDTRKLLVEADSYISHMRHRGSWPGDDFDVDRLIGRLRKASEKPPTSPTGEKSEGVERLATELLGELRPWELQPDGVRQACFRLTMALAVRGAEPTEEEPPQ